MFRQPISWSVDFNIGDERAREALSEDVLWNAYPLGNLAPPHRRFMTVARARSSDGRHACCVVFQPPGFAVVVPSGDIDGVREIVEPEVAGLPSGAELMVLPEHVGLFDERFVVEPIEWMYRIQVTAKTWRPFGDTGRVSRLAPAALPELTALYRESGMPFHSEQIEAGFFYGLWDGDRLVAAAGTHNLSHAEKVVALGSLYVRPESRRAGVGRELTIARVEALLASGFQNIVANVSASNHPSLELHARLGFSAPRRFLRARIATSRTVRSTSRWPHRMRRTETG